MKRSNLQSVIFDFDYTLADSSQGAIECINFALREMGLDHVSDEAACRTIGLSLAETFLTLGEHHEQRRCNEFHQLFVQRADQVMVDFTVLYESVPPMVEALRERGLRLGIVSTKYRRRITEVLQREALLHGFEVVIGGDDVAEHKPHPQGLLEALERLECSPGSVVYVGDSQVDAELAKRAGVPLVIVLSGATPRQHFDEYKPLALLENISHLPEFLTCSVMLIRLILIVVALLAFETFLFAQRPAPTPNINPDAYIPPRPPGRTMTVASSSQLSEAIQRAQDDPKVTSVRVLGGGSIRRPVVLKKYTTFDSSTYSCDVTPENTIFRDRSITDYGCFLVSDGVYVGGTYRPPQTVLDYFKSGDGRNPNDRYLQAVQALTAEQLAGNGTTILEPTYVNKSVPAVEVFQALGDACCSHTGKASNITIQGFRIKGRQTVYDGGVRSTILLGNCRRCAVMDVYLEDTASIGVTAGGSALESKLPDGGVNKDNFARDIVFTRNIFSGVAAANTATINTEDAYVFHNYVRRPGHHNPKFGGGVCGHDHETNSRADHTRNIYVYNNLYDYEGAHREAAGNAICLQDPYVGANRGRVSALNNVIIGGRNDVVHRYMSNGLFLNGLKDCRIINNYIFRTGQNAIQIYNISNCLIEDNIFDSTGGGGNSTFWSRGMRDTIVRRNTFIKRPIPINMQAGFLEICGERNQYIDNLIPGVAGPAPPARKCP